QILNALIAGDIQASFMVPGIAMPQVEAGKIRALAITSRAESPLLPNLPTVHESGFEDFEAISWNALYVPNGTPDEIVEHLNTRLTKKMQKDEVVNRLNSLYYTAEPLTTEEMDERAEPEKST